jgi:hypothetical protein
VEDEEDDDEDMIRHYNSNRHNSSSNHMPSHRLSQHSNENPLLNGGETERSLETVVAMK